MAGEHAVPNAQLVRRRIDYQEVAEYRMLHPSTGIAGKTSASDLVTTTSTGKIASKALDDPAFRKPLSVQVDESPARSVDDRVSIS